jgi:nucleoside-diphosphate-sugar epimerase
MMGSMGKGERIAILGATSHIAKGLIYHLGQDGNYDLCLFARSPERADEFLNAVGLGNRFKAKPIEEFGKESYGSVINCVGIGDPGKLSNAGSSIFKITETFDTLALDHQQRSPNTLYINFSSGAVYGTDFVSPVDDRNQATFKINPMDPAAYYGIAKLYSEARHRAMKDFRIVDLRIFSYFSRFIDLDAKYMMSEIMSCILHGKEFVTNSEDIVRDFIHPEDLASLVKLCIAKRDLNDAFDVCSLQPVKKFEILEKFSSLYGLRYTIEERHDSVSVTGRKANYYSTNGRIQAIGFSSRFTSMNCLIQESTAILESH